MLSLSNHHNNNKKSGTHGKRSWSFDSLSHLGLYYLTGQGEMLSSVLTCAGANGNSGPDVHTQMTKKLELSWIGPVYINVHWASPAGVLCPLTHWSHRWIKMAGREGTSTNNLEDTQEGGFWNHPLPYSTPSQACKANDNSWCEGLSLVCPQTEVYKSPITFLLATLAVFRNKAPSFPSSALPHTWYTLTVTSFPTHWTVCGSQGAGNEVGGRRQRWCRKKGQKRCFFGGRDAVRPPYLSRTES